MKRLSVVRSGLSLAALAVLSATVFTWPGQAAQAGSAAACNLGIQSVNTAGDQPGNTVEASTPPSMRSTGITDGVYQPGQVRLSTTAVFEPNIAGTDVSSWVVQGDSLYFSFYATNDLSNKTLQRIGGGWTNFTALEIAQYDEGPDGSAHHSLAYGLRNDGTLFRWNVAGGTWRAAGSAAGFASVKSMALISKTSTYDTFLANTRGGALYTIRIPVASPMQPVVKPVRSSTWQGFEKLIAGKCGQYGTLLLGIDKDGQVGYLYAVGHANGTSTVINALGKISGTFPDPVYFRTGVVPYLDPLNGD
ncbi:hypothetical protein ACIBL3_03270 [Kribbella sp. NPDC050124]|uniref:hypothetical protein n=1 Tax=Kribbella sp. NPDC050124 TaxID=3364114 RepID=UPI0037B112A8